MSQYITVNEYAALHHKQPVSVRKLAQRGSLKSAKKIGGVWLIDKEEQYPDHRRSGSVKSFEMVRGMYLVDEIAYVEGLPSTYVRIGDQCSGASWTRPIRNRRRCRMIRSRGRTRNAR